jgi:alpha/beta superfamily hydrolase
MAFFSTVRNLDDLHGAAGRLEALLNTGTPDAPYAALVAHPHPLFGGTMHNKVVYHAMKAFSHFGLPVLRFNFRGTGLSEGAHDEGRGEIDDVRAAVDYLATLYNKPILFAGFSFGSYTGLRATCGDPRVAGHVGLGLPVQAAGRDYTYEFIANCTQPKLFISGDHDEFCPSEVLKQVVASSPGKWDCFIVPGADHFFQGIPESPKPKLEDMRKILRTWLIWNFKLTSPEQVSGS